PGYAPQPGYAPPPGYVPPGAPYGQPPRRNNRNLLFGIIGGVVVVALLLVVVVVALARGGVPTTAHNSTPTATTTAATPTSPAATATPAAQIIYQDTMTDSPSGWPNDANCSEQSDGYHVTTGVICFSPVSSSTGDASMGATVQEVTTTSSSSFGLAFRRASNGNYYGFEITPDGKWVFYKSVNGTATTIQDYTANSAITTGANASNDLQVVAIGPQFTFFVNGTQVGTATDSTFSAGEWGVDGTNNTEVVYTNVLVLAA
ncbi:MAG TPA: hypothetical protein VMV29_02625, partial [Ktedonobacterales bacterium]|nr:hypothetical protein [Ktedonobacterales bacterium]